MQTGRRRRYRCERRRRGSRSASERGFQFLDSSIRPKNVPIGRRRRLVQRDFELADFVSGDLNVGKFQKAALPSNFAATGEDAFGDFTVVHTNGVGRCIKEQVNFEIAFVCGQWVRFFPGTKTRPFRAATAARRATGRCGSDRQTVRPRHRSKTFHTDA